MIKILIVEDEKNQRELLSSSLKDDYDTITAASGKEAFEIFEDDRTIGIIISDFKMDDMDGIELLKRVKRCAPDVIFILITAYASVSSAVTALKLGAYDYITKPIVIEKLKVILKRAVESYFLLIENRELKEKLKMHYSFEKIITKSPRMKEILSIVSRVSHSKTTVLITGESGTGKELIARAIYNASDRNDRPFIPINCSAIPETLLESELFGYEKGAFTGAVKTKKGKLEIADRGTAFFDEVGDVPLTIQVKLLRFLQFGEIVPLGRETSLHVDVRIICSTNKDLRKKIEEGIFREDLFYRLNVVEIHIPPLRERKEDITPLVNHFIKKYSKVSGKSIEGISNEAMRYLFSYNWPGNVRELESLIERAIVMSRDTIIDVDDLPISLKGIEEKEGDLALKMVEKKHIERVLGLQGGNISKAAEILGIHRNTLMSKLKEYNINRND
ncbi:MAG: sigma-54-dependent Fis family transcriptional regulator [Candidatus Cloacimonadota bacterium]|nr:MAG: sigma-54-dependent Fis family transcriptional regulator [Candidatus Cloacimonadota bacterium]